MHDNWDTARTRRLAAALWPSSIGSAARCRWNWNSTTPRRHREGLRRLGPRQREPGRTPHRRRSVAPQAAGLRRSTTSPTQTAAKPTSPGGWQFILPVAGGAAGNSAFTSSGRKADFRDPTRSANWRFSNAVPYMTKRTTTLAMAVRFVANAMDVGNQCTFNHARIGCSNSYNRCWPFGVIPRAHITIRTPSELNIGHRYLDSARNSKHIFSSESKR